MESINQVVTFEVFYKEILCNAKFEYLSQSKRQAQREINYFFHAGHFREADKNEICRLSHNLFMNPKFIEATFYENDGKGNYIAKRKCNDEEEFFNINSRLSDNK